MGSNMYTLQVISFLQAFLIAVTAQFIPLLVYSYRDPDPEVRMNSVAYQRDNLQKSLAGYVRYSLTDFPISVLLNDDSNPFPLASAIALNYYESHDDVEPTDYYYQPYHSNVSCFYDQFPGFNVTFPLGPEVFYLANRTADEYLPYFREDAWSTFTNNYKIDPDEDHRGNYISCINQSYPCR